MHDFFRDSKNICTFVKAENITIDAIAYTIVALLCAFFGIPGFIVYSTVSTGVITPLA